MKQFFKYGFFFIFLLLLMPSIHTVDYPEFLYPVGSVQFEDTTKICVLYQKGTYLELLLWDPITKKVIKGLSHYAPAGLMVLPSKTAFSFIDHQRIRIKSVAKKSPKAFDLYPLYDFSLLYWIDDNNFYCSARERANYNLFHITGDGDFFRLTRSNMYDYTYPQKIDSDFFYIKKDNLGTYSIEKTAYPVNAIQECSSCLGAINTLTPASSLDALETTAINADSNFAKACLIEKPETIFTCPEKDSALTFLTMKSNVEGYFLKHLDCPFIERFATRMAFECWHLSKENDTWHTKKLFTFELPLHFLYGQHRLYESGLRLFPISIEGAFIYTSANKEGYLDVYRYSMSDSSITCLTHNEQEHYFFPPYIHGQVGYYGGMLSPDENNFGLSMTLNKDGEQMVTFPFISI